MKENFLQKKTGKELKQMYLELYDTVNVVECFGVKDVVLLGLVEQELEERGIDIKLKPVFS